MSGLPLRSVHETLGARFGEVGGVMVPRNYGDPAAEYAAARSGAAVVDRSERGRIRVFGRDPVRIVHGLVTNDVAGAGAGQGVYAALLTPKGKMLADLRIFRLASGEIVLDVEAAAKENVLATFRKYVPPLFARFEDVSAGHGVLGVFGPGAREAIARVVTDLPAADAPEDAFLETAFDGAPLLVARTLFAGVDGYDLFAPADSLVPLWHGLVDAGARPMGHGTLDVLRIEAGRPLWGAELDENVIPLEAGLRERAISDTKGCYTGQEVIIRILHRGHVNWHLRGMLLGDVPVPARGAPLLREGESRQVGRVTSACSSPAFEQTIALGYVRREVEPPAELRLGAPDGPPVRVVSLPFGDSAELAGGGFPG
ncbi:MAG TPA: aminomethyltransferase family protein [Longimicrobiales bacterium]|nr:aminomethyltransferase family protein [Longimicrobiales bacterium]